LRELYPDVHWLALETNLSNLLFVYIGVAYLSLPQTRGATAARMFVKRSLVQVR
jgi:hypothetical protein